MQVEAVCLLLEKNELTKALMILKRLACVAQNTHTDIRESIAKLRTDFSVSQGLWKPLEKYVQWYRQNNDIDAKLIVDKGFTVKKLSPAIELQLLRIIQEALTNIRKHAGARHVTIRIDCQEAALEIQVVDDGHGFNAASIGQKGGCYGLTIMKERAKEAGVELSIESTPHVGTNVKLLVPLTESI